jgi:S-adenosylmethionine-diacylgycerolhomoserine-N-methlytransferase
MYRSQRHIYDLTRRFFLLGRERLLATVDVPEGGTVLEIGCGTARNLIRIAHAYPSARLFGLDVSDEMLKSAAQAIGRAGLANQIRVSQGDALTFDADRLFGAKEFDRICFSYSLSMIPSWRDALARSVTMLSPQGSLHVVDFGQCEGLPTLFRALLFRWLRQFHVEPREGLVLEFSRLTRVHGAIFKLDSILGGYGWLLSFNKISPRSAGAAVLRAP